jgi:Uma2 family endonuclease
MTTELLERKYTLEEFLELDLPEEDGPYELIRGMIVPKRKIQPAPSSKHGEIMSIIAGHFRTYIGENGKGKVYSSAACKVGQNYVIPDVAFLVSGRTPTDPDSPLPYPDIAVEIMSRSDKLFEVRDKVTDYLNAGTRLVWVIFHPDKMVLVYKPDTNKPLLLGSDDELTAEPVLPDFRIAVSKLFE